MSLSKDLANYFAKTMFSLREVIKNIWDQETVIPMQSVINFCDSHHNKLL